MKAASSYVPPPLTFRGVGLKRAAHARAQGEKSIARALSAQLAVLCRNAGFVELFLDFDDMYCRWNAFSELLVSGSDQLSGPVNVNWLYSLSIQGKNPKNVKKLSTTGPRIARYFQVNLGLVAESVCMV